MRLIRLSLSHGSLTDRRPVPTRDPDYLFSAPNYRRLGSLFWPDYWKTAPENPIWQIMGVKARDEWEMEAGQILIDKGRHLDIMVLSQFMLQDPTFWYLFSDGDKDIFRFAALMLRKRWGAPGRFVGVGGLPRGTASGDFCGLSQYTPPLFVCFRLRPAS